MIRRALFSVLFGLLLITSYAAFFDKSAMATGYHDVTVSEAKTMVDSNPSLIVLDVRNQSEYYSGHIKDAKLIPVEELEGRLGELNVSDEILVCCGTGGRSATASQILVNHGFPRIYSTSAGVNAWTGAGYPMYVKYSSIQAAIDSASEGSTIYVSSGIYEEHLIVNKSLTMIGENKDTTAVDGTNNGTVFHVKADNVSISNFKIAVSGCACFGYCGVLIESNHRNVNVTDNILFFNGFGIKADWAQEVVIAHNSITDNLDYSVVVSNSSVVQVVENNIVNSVGGIKIGNTTSLVVSSNTVSGNLYALEVSVSDDNSFIGNTFSSGSASYGIYFGESNNNLILHNNFVQNGSHVVNRNSTNSWDNGFEGNYWSSHTGVDGNLDGIGDTPQTIDANNTDNYPLAGTFSSFSTSIGKFVNVVSNSTIEDFTYFESNSTIRMHVSNATTGQAHGFCRVCVPYSLINETVYVTVDGLSPTYFNYSLYDNGTHRWIYFDYEHSKVEIIIIPEFPFATVLLLMMAAPVTIAVHRGRRRPPEKASTSHSAFCVTVSTRKV